jgi:protein-S-isoprenylcysteine O-methyltransferase Ste14
MDVYYYRDLFQDEAGDGGLVTTGPYSIFSNPMYGVGNLSLYGAAIEAGSFEGLLVAIIFQGSIYFFYGMVELPFIRQVYSSHD